MRTITLEELLEAGCHFGHQVTRQNPKARDFVYEARDNIHIIDLAKTKEGLEQAAAFVKQLAQKGGNLVVVGTKRQAQPIVKEEVQRALSQSEPDSGQAQNSETNRPRIFSVTNRWIGGTLTNFSEVSKNYKKLKDLAKRLKDPEEKAKYTKKEVGLWEKDRIKLESFYGGISDMERLPQALFIIDTHLEKLAVSEAQKMNVATLGIVDTNADPGGVSYPIPANDDAVGSIQLITRYIIDAFLEGAQKNQESGIKNQGEEDKPKATKKTSVKKTKKEKEENVNEKPKKRKTRKQKLHDS